MKRLVTMGVLLLALAACGSDPATMFAGGLRGWCQSSHNCTDHTRN